MASSLINEMQSCQGLLEFVDSKLEAMPSSYDKNDVKTVRKGLKSYNQYIQREIVAPGLLAFNGGDKTKANLMQKQVDTYKKTIVKQLNDRYPQNRLFTEQAVSINNCAKKAVPSGEELEALKKALTTMIELSKVG